MSQREFELTHKRWLAYAGKALAQRGWKNHINPIEVVNDTFACIAMELPGYVCPKETEFAKFFVQKLRTSIERFVKQSQRYVARHAEYDVTAIAVDMQEDDFYGLIPEYVSKLSQNLGTRTGVGLRAYIQALPEIIAKDLEQKDVAQILKCKPGNLANYRDRLERRFEIHPEPENKNDKK